MSGNDGSVKMAADVFPYVGEMLKQRHTGASLRRDGEFKNVMYMTFPNGEEFELVVWNLTPDCARRVKHE